MKKFQEKNKHLQEDQEDEEDQETMEDDDELHSQEKEQEVIHRSGDRVCEQCGKRFSNGKALGGHIKVHFNQSLLPKKTTKFKPKNKHLSNKGAHEPLDADNNNSTSCYVCHKNFPSTKSLHGHMRLHRERDWKGVRPPGVVLPSGEESNSSSSHNNVSEEEEEDDDDVDDGYLSHHTIETVVDAANFLVNWEKIEEKRVRRRSQIGEFSGKKMIDEESPFRYKSNPSSKTARFDCRSTTKITMEASKSTGGAKVTGVLTKDIDLNDQIQKQIPRKPRELRIRSSDTKNDVKMDGHSGFSCAYSNDEVGEHSVKKPIHQSPDGYKGTHSLKIKLKLDGISSKTMEGSKSSDGASLVPNKSSIGGKGKILMEADDENVADPSSWKLRSKKMMMKSASETHKQIPRKTDEYDTKYAERGKYHSSDATRVQILDKAEAAHALGHRIKQFVCNICPSKFSTGQALGGHMRGHNYRVLPVEEAQATAEVVSMDLEDGEISPDPGKFDLDLNQPPLEFYDNEETAG